MNYELKHCVFSITRLAVNGHILLKKRFMQKSLEIFLFDLQEYLNEDSIVHKFHSSNSAHFT